uniref:Uncharacterized protein n=1 Tax=Salix viminalis TaxID=40686 RepID=A0A6N2KK67_SALVM
MQENRSYGRIVGTSLKMVSSIIIVRKQICSKLHIKSYKIGQNRGYRWNESRGQTHLTNSEEPTHQFNTIEVEDSIKKRLNI